MAVRLNSTSVEDLKDAVPVPSYDRLKLVTGIVHLGVGGFHRAHQALYLDLLMNQHAEGAMGWGICGVGVLPGDRRIIEALSAQDGLYTLVTKHPNGSRDYRVVGSIAEVLLAPDDPQRVVDVMSRESTRIVSLTITEGGYLVNQATGDFDPSDEGIQHDLEHDDAPQTAFGLITTALAARRNAGAEPFTVMSCDNLPGNGDLTRRMITSFARLKDPALADWMDQHVHFPNSMVDRITPVTTAEDIEDLSQATGIEDQWPVVCEPFTQWVLQDSFGQGRPPLEQAGVQIVDDVAPFELMKLRMLNAGHQALAYLGYLAGYRYADEVARDELFAKFVGEYMAREAAPTLPTVPDTDVDAYRQTLLERFGNPEVKDTVARLASNASDRIPKFLVPVIEHNLADGGSINLSALIVAAWARYAEGLDEGGAPIEVVDRLKDRLMTAAAAYPQDDLAFVRDRDLFADLADDERFASAYRRHLASLHDKGAYATLREVLSGS